MVDLQHMEAWTLLQSIEPLGAAAGIMDFEELSLLFVKLVGWHSY